jgi:hypothetical protein
MTWPLFNLVLGAGIEELGLENYTDRVEESDGEESCRTGGQSGWRF